MKVKKMLSAVLAGLMVFGLAACGNKESSDSKKKAEMEKMSMTSSICHHLQSQSIGSMQR